MLWWKRTWHLSLNKRSHQTVSGALLFSFGRQMSGPRGALTSLLTPPGLPPTLPTAQEPHFTSAWDHRCPPQQRWAQTSPALSRGRTLDPHRSPSPALSLLPSTFGADGTPVMATGPGSWLAGTGGCRQAPIPDPGSAPMFTSRKQGPLGLTPCRPAPLSLLPGSGYRNMLVLLHDFTGMMKALLSSLDVG